MGDFNSLPEDAILDPIRERMKDAADRFDIPRLSFPSDYPDRKIDYIFLSRDIEVISADIPVVIASDHRPHTATVAL
jgi:endonuclease/exonuclease/phosphatase family metal-dependent hydrolase